MIDFNDDLRSKQESMDKATLSYKDSIVYIKKNNGVKVTIEDTS